MKQLDKAWLVVNKNIYIFHHFTEWDEIRKRPCRHSCQPGQNLVSRLRESKTNFTIRETIVEQIVDLEQFTIALHHSVHFFLKQVQNPWIFSQKQQNVALVPINIPPRDLHPFCHALPAFPTLSLFERESYERFAGSPHCCRGVIYVKPHPSLVPKHANRILDPDELKSSQSYQHSLVNKSCLLKWKKW